MRATAAGAEPARIPSSTCRCSSASADGVCHAGRSCAMQSRISPSSARVEAREARRPDRVHERHVEGHVGLDDVAPADVVAQRLEPLDGGACRGNVLAPRGQRADGVQLDRGAGEEDVPDRVGGELRHRGRVVRPALQQALVDEQLERLAHRRAGDAVAADELELGQPGPRRDLAAQDAVAQRARERLRRGHGLELERHDAAASGAPRASATAPPPARRASRARPPRAAPRDRVPTWTTRSAGASARASAARSAPRAAAGAHDRGERAVQRTQRGVDQRVLRRGDRDDGRLEALEQRPHAGDASGTPAASRATASAPAGAQRNPRSTASASTAGASASELRRERAQAPGERAAAVHRRLPVTARDLVDQRLLRGVEIDQHASERHRDGGDAAVPRSHAARPYIV